MSNSNYQQQNPVTFPKDFIVILIHGWLGNASAMDDLINTLKGLGVTESYWHAVYPNVTITQNDVQGSPAFNAIQNAINQKANANVFIKISFGDDDAEGTIMNQSSQLFNTILHLKSTFQNKKIATVGYSKGGVVAMECAIDHPGYIDKLISISTPYTTTIANHLYGFVSNCLQLLLGASINQIATSNYSPVYTLFANYFINNALQSIVNSYINNQIVMPNIKQRWNQMTNRPDFTPIASRLLSIDNDLESDGAVPIESALASGFYGKKYSDDVLLVKDDNFKMSVSTYQYISGLFDFLGLIDTINELANVSNSVSFTGLALSIVQAILSATVMDSTTKAGCAKFAHTSNENFFGNNDCVLKNEIVAWRVLAGLDD